MEETLNLFDNSTGMEVTSNCGEQQDAFSFPQSLTEKYRPKTFSEFAGMEKQRRILQAFAANPYPKGFLFLGGPGTGKTSMGLALAQAIPAELHHIPSTECTVDYLKRVRFSCQYVPMTGYKMHLVLVDEADQMSTAAQNACLSYLDGTDTPPATVFVFTCNAVDRFEERFLSRNLKMEFSTYGIAAPVSELLQRVWIKQGGTTTNMPNFARIVKESNNNVREALQRLETELLAI